MFFQHNALDQRWLPDASFAAGKRPLDCFVMPGFYHISKALVRGIKYKTLPIKNVPVPIAVAIPGLPVTVELKKYRL